MTDKEIENLVNWLQSCTAKKFYSADAEDLIFEFKNQALSQHDVSCNEVALIEPLRNFIRSKHLSGEWEKFLEDYQRNQ